MNDYKLPYFTINYNSSSMFFEKLYYVAFAHVQYMLFIYY